MKKEIALLEPELPQLRQAVLENTRRINQNEQMITEMRKREAEKEKERRERDQQWESSRQEQERQRHIIDERLDRITRLQEKSIMDQDKRYQELKEMFAETDRRMEESTRLMKEQIAEADKQMREQIAEADKQLREQIAETDKQLRDTSLEVKRLSRQLTGTTGHIVEGLVSSSTERIFEKAGLKLHDSGKNVKRHLASEHIAMEVDVLLSNDKMAVSIEVKTSCSKGDVHWFLHQMELFRRLFPEYDGKEVIAAIAAINYEKGVAEFARKEGLLVIRVNSEDVFSVDPFKEKDLRRF